MTRVIVAASIDNELESKDIAAVKRLQQAGYEIQFYYYLPKVPAEFSMIPSFNDELKNWKIHAKKMLEELGNKLDITQGNRHFVDEVLGPDRVFDEAKEMKADIILTSDSNHLKQTKLSKFYDKIAALFRGKKEEKEVPIEDVSRYVSEKLGGLKGAGKFQTESAAVNDERMQRDFAKKTAQRH